MIARLLNWLCPPEPVSEDDRVKCITWMRAVVQGDIYCKAIDERGYCYIGNHNKNGEWLPDDLHKQLNNEAFHSAWNMKDEEIIERYKNRYRRVFADRS